LAEAMEYRMARAQPMAATYVTDGGQPAINMTTRYDVRDALEAEFVCIPRPALTQTVVEGDPGLSI
jgi:hypothetical protein